MSWTVRVASLHWSDARGFVEISRNSVRFATRLHRIDTKFSENSEILRLRKVLLHLRVSYGCMRNIRESDHTREQSTLVNTKNH